MTGQELFHALSFVDERYVEEAEEAYLNIKTPWRKWVSVAACLCILIVGAFALESTTDKCAAPEAAEPPAALAPEIMAEAAPEVAPPMMEESPAEERGEPMTIPGELHYVAFAQLRILEILEDGSFTVYVERVAEEPRAFDAGVQMRLVIDPEMIPAADRTDAAYSDNVAIDMLVEVQGATYDAGINTLYAEGMFAAAIE